MSYNRKPAWGLRLARGMRVARRAGDHADHVLVPLAAIVRGLRRHAVWARAWWVNSPKDRRGPTLLLAGAVVVAVVLLPYGSLLAIIGLAATAGWAGRERPAAASPAQEAADSKLAALYAALTPYLAHPDDPQPLYTRDGDHKSAFSGWQFDEEQQLTLLELSYPAYFTDTEAAARARVEQVVQAKAGRAREYRFQWELENNRLRTEALGPLPDDIAVQRFSNGPGEIVLGFTDATDGTRAIPLDRAGTVAHHHPVSWRIGAGASEPHLLALGTPGSGTSTLLRAIALQAIQYGDIVVIDGACTGEFGCLVGRPGVRAVESGLRGALMALEWAVGETDRRLAALDGARNNGYALPADVARPLVLLLDQPTELSELAHAEDLPDPQEMLERPLRHGRAARISVVVADRVDAYDRVDALVRATARARVVLGTPTAEQARAALGAPLDITPAARTPAGRGYARTGRAQPVRLQVPAAPDPLDERAPVRQRDAVIAMLAQAAARAEASPPPPAGLVKAPAAARPQA